MDLSLERDGPGHAITLEVEFILGLCSERRVRMMTDDGSKEYEALRFDDEEGKHIVTGPISNPRNPDEEEIMTVCALLG